MPMMDKLLQTVNGPEVISVFLDITKFWFIRGIDLCFCDQK